MVGVAVAVSVRVAEGVAVAVGVGVAVGIRVGMGVGVAAIHALLAARGLPNTGFPSASMPMALAVLLTQAESLSLTRPTRSIEMRWSSSPAGQPPPSRLALSTNSPDAPTKRSVSPLLLRLPV